MPFSSRAAARTAFLGLLSALLAGTAPAHAQLGGGLGGGRLGLPSLPTIRLPVQQTLDTARNTVPLPQLRLSTARELLRQHPDLLEMGPAGELVRRAELVVLSPTLALLEAAQAQGFAVLREQNLPELELRQVVLRPPARMDTARALALLRSLQPDVEADFNHVYATSGTSENGNAAASATNAATLRVGLIDGGVDVQHPALRHTALHAWGCQGKALPSVHGTAVASLLVGVGDAPQTGSANLYAADIYCEQPAGGAAEDVAAALAWMAREQVAVVNISLVGPSNRLLERSVQALVRRGYLLVAAVGNDGPAAPPLYPASYAGVVGVTGVTTSQRVLPEAAQGPQVMFAAIGAQVRAARMGGGYDTVRGTSFAAPRVASLLAQQLPQPDVVQAQAALARLASSARDLGAPGRDPVYGLGLVGLDKP